MEYTKSGDEVYEQSSNPVQPPPGFRRPDFKIGARVKLVMTTLNPMSRGRFDGVKGTVKMIIFCKSDGETILYGVEFDEKQPGASGIRCDGWELDLLEDQTPLQAKESVKEKFEDSELCMLITACQVAAYVSRKDGHNAQADEFLNLADKVREQRDS